MCFPVTGVHLCILNRFVHTLYFAVGTMIDAYYSGTVTKREGEEFALDNRFDLFFETSAKTGENVQTVSS